MEVLRLAARFWHEVGATELAIAALTFPLTAFGAACTYLLNGKAEGPQSWRGFLRFCFPAQIVKSPQTRLDLLFVAVKKFTRFLWRWGFVSNLVCASLFFALLARFWPALPVATHAPSGLERACFLAGAVVLTDFFGFIAHYFLHKAPVLWEFHKVHHSALTLIPVTNHRFHPVQELWDALWVSAGTGLWIALYARIAAVPLLPTSMLGLDAAILVNCLSFHHLRHSHIYMRYPRWLERLLMSPAQHQIHHSRETRHLDRNFGLLLPWWDQLFGTIVYSEPVPVTNLGLVDGQDDHLTVWGLFTAPFAGLARNYIVPLWRKVPVSS